MAGVIAGVDDICTTEPIKARHRVSEVTLIRLSSGVTQVNI